MVPLVRLAAFPTNLFELLNHSKTYEKGFTPKPSTQDEYEQFAAVCNLSNIATILYVLYHEPGISDEENTKIIIHVVGAHTEIALFSKHECWLLFHWLPAHIHSIIIHFIGPDLPEDVLPYSEVIYKSNRTNIHEQIVNMHYHRETYETFIELANLEQNSSTTHSPQLILCLNAGFTEYDGIPNQVNPWISALDEMLRFMNVPIAFTSYIKFEANADMTLLQQRASILSVDLDIVFDGIQNPFRDLRPYRNWEHNDDEEIFFYNGYLNVVMVKSKENN